MRVILTVILLLWGTIARAEVLDMAGKTAYQVKMARTPEELSTGLMGVRHLPENEGMLFDLRAYPKAKMWMKNTYISLDMLFMDCDFKVVDIYEKAVPLSLQKIGSEHKFCYVLEINGGQAEKHGIVIGDEAVLHRSD